MSKLPDFLGPYRLARFIRSGNSTQIWEAIPGDGGDRCVLKVLNRQLWGKRAEIGYLKHEYEVAHKLNHPNIIKIHDFNVDGKIGYLVLELFTDLNIKQAMRERGHTTLHVNFSKIVEQAASALQYMHDHGWVHCDVKPDNFLLDESCRLKLIDFTISQRIATGFGKFFRRKGVVRGTRSYMSPEQIRNEALDARADIYSLACVMYELLAGKPPFTGESPNDLLNKHLKAAIPNVQVSNDNVTPELADLIRRMMLKTRQERPESLTEVLKDFRSIRWFKLAPKPAATPGAETQSETEG